MCDLPAKRDAFDAWLISDVARIECLRELRLPKDIDYDEVGDDGTPHHITKITLKLTPCVCGVALSCDCPVWSDLGWTGVRGTWALSALGFPETEELLMRDVDDGLTEISYRWPTC